MNAVDTNILIYVHDARDAVKRIKGHLIRLYVCEISQLRRIWGEYREAITM